MDSLRQQTAIPNLDDFRAFYELADRLIDTASKEDGAEVACLLALNVTHYQQKYGALQFESFADMLRADSIDAQTAELLSVGMQNLVGALAQVTGLVDDGTGDEIHQPLASAPADTGPDSR